MLSNPWLVFSIINDLFLNLCYSSQFQSDPEAEILISTSVLRVNMRVLSRTGTLTSTLGSRWECLLWNIMGIPPSLHWRTLTLPSPRSCQLQIASWFESRTSWPLFFHSAMIFVWLDFVQVLCTLSQSLNSYVRMHFCVWKTLFPWSHPPLLALSDPSST